MKFDSHYLTVPNALCAVRLLATPALVYIAYRDWPWLFLAGLMILLLADWLDGKLARWLNQRTEFGARFDSVADGVLYAAALAGIYWLRPAFLQEEWPWWGAALGSFALHLMVGVARFGRPPSYHTYGAKLSWLLVAVATPFVVLGGSPWPFRVAMAVVALANIEAIVMTWVLPRWKSDVPSLKHAWQERLSEGE